MSKPMIQKFREHLEEYTGHWQHHLSFFLPVISLLTDFGGRDTYVGQVKAAIIANCRHARIIDLTHDIEPQNIRHAAFLIHKATQVFPEGSVHMAVVDPGVGTDRAVICVDTGRTLYLAPDNGLLSDVLEKENNVKVYSVTNDKYFRKTVWPTFHGRDIFAPVAGHLAAGIEPCELGPEIAPEELIKLEMKTASKENGSIRGEVLFVDHFGNAVTNIPAELYDDAAHNACEVSLNGKNVGLIRNTFSDTVECAPVAYTGSFGNLEIAVRNGSAADILNAAAGSEIEIKLQ